MIINIDEDERDLLLEALLKHLEDLDAENSREFEVPMYAYDPGLIEKLMLGRGLVSDLRNIKYRAE